MGVPSEVGVERDTETTGFSGRGKQGIINAEVDGRSVGDGARVFEVDYCSFRGVE